MKIPYQLVSMAAMLRDFFALNSDDYLNKEHQMLTDIADYLYNSADGAFSDHPEDNLLPEFKVIFDNYGADYFKQVTDDMYAIDSQVTSTAKADELYEDYQDRLKSGVMASTRVTASYSEDYYDFDDFVMDLGDRLAERKISRADADREIKKFCRDHRTCDYRTLHNIVYENAAGKVDAENDRLRKQIKDRAVKASDNPFYDKLSAKDKKFANQVKEDVGVITLKGKVGKYDTYLTIDMWYGDKFEPMKYGADASFYGNDGEYHGNIYNDVGEIIGDYTSDDSTLISKNFQIDWGD